MTEAAPDYHNDACYRCIQGGELLCCSYCTLAFHMECLNPPLKSVPSGSWRCPVCRAESSGIRACPPRRRRRHQRLPQGLRARFVLQGVHHPTLELTGTHALALRRKWSAVSSLSSAAGASDNPSRGKPQTNQRPAVGARVELYWKLDDAWYPGSVCGYKGSPPDDLAQIQYDDGATEHICLGEEPWRYEGKKVLELSTAAASESAPAPAPAATPVSQTSATKAAEPSGQGVQRGTSNFLGVSRPSNASHWLAQIRVNGVTRMLGNFQCELEAARAFDAAAYRFRGPGTPLNFPDEMPVRERETEAGTSPRAGIASETAQEQAAEPRGDSGSLTSCTTARRNADEGRRKSRKPWYLSDYQHSFEDTSHRQESRTGSAKVHRDVSKTQETPTLAAPHCGNIAKPPQPMQDSPSLLPAADTAHKGSSHAVLSSEVVGTSDSRESDIRGAAPRDDAQPEMMLQEPLSTVDIVHANDDQSPTEIAALYEVSLDEVMQLNRHRFGGFTRTCKLMEGTPILIPTGTAGTRARSRQHEGEPVGQISEQQHDQPLHTAHQRQLNNAEDHKEKQKPRIHHHQENVHKRASSNLPSPRRSAGSSSDWLTTLLLRESEFTTGDSHGLREGQRVGVAKSTGRGFSKTGTVTRWSVKCDCCKHVFSLAGFERHGSCENRSPYNSVHAITTQLNNRSQPLCVSAWPIVAKEEGVHLQQKQVPILSEEGINGISSVRAAQYVHVPASGGENCPATGTGTGQANESMSLSGCIGCQRGWYHICRSMNPLRSRLAEPETPARSDIESIVPDAKSSIVMSAQGDSTGNLAEGQSRPNLAPGQDASQEGNQRRSAALLAEHSAVVRVRGSSGAATDAGSAMERQQSTPGHCSSQKQADDTDAAVRHTLADIVTEIEQRVMHARPDTAAAKRKALEPVLPERSGRKRKISSRFANYSTDLHGDLAAVTKAESKVVKEEQEENQALCIVLGVMLELLVRMDCFGLFAEPVNKREVPDYARMIRRPMDYSTMRKKLDRKGYSSVAHFGQDAMLICKNAMTFNSEGDVHYAAAENLMEFTKCMIEHVTQHERSSFADVDLPTLMKGLRADQTNALYMRTRDNEDALYMQAAIRRTSAVAQQAVLVPLGTDGVATQRRSAVSLKVHERFLLDALHAAAEDKRSRVFQETDAGCARCETYAQHRRYKQMRRAKSAAGGVRSAHVRAKNASSASIGDNGTAETPMTEDQLHTLPRVDIHHLMLRGSEIQGWGLFTKVRIEAESVVIEYYGEYLRNKIADLKQEQYERRRMADYMFRVGDDMVLDATYRGGRARFINHSCDPNCYAKIIACADGKNRIFIISKRAIDVSAEITYDYQFEPEEVKIPCLCGAANCRGTLN